MIFGLLAAVCLTVIILYKTGQGSILSRAENVDIALEDLSNATEDSVQKVRERFLGSGIDWNNDWVIYNDKVYEYKKDTINLLVLGIDTAGGLATETDFSNWDAGQADAIFVLSFHPDSKEASIVAIPRNSMVVLDVYGPDGTVQDYLYNQICLQYGYAGGGQNGLKAMNKVVSDLLYGLPIMGELAIGYDAVPLINDTVGGVEVEVIETIPWDEELFEGNVLTLNGEQAYLYVQARDTSVVGSPTARLARQKQYLNGLFHTAIAKIKDNPGIIVTAYNDLTPYMNSAIPVNEIVYLGMEAVGYSFDLDAIHMLEGHDVTSETIAEDGTTFVYDDYYLDEENVKQTVIDVFFREVTPE